MMTHGEIQFAVFEALAAYRDSLPDALRKEYPFFVGRLSSDRVMIFGGKDDPTWIVRVERHG